MHDVPGVPCRNYRPRPAVPKGDIRLIPLGDGFYAYVDAADYEWLSRWKWHVHGGYAGRNENRKTILMHRQIMQPPEGKLVDHIDANRLNNCRCNLRVCTRPENQRNTRKQHGTCSQYKGVYYDKRRGKWCAECKFAKAKQFLGSFDLEVDAARAYDRAAVLYYGEFGRLNFPEEWPPERRAQLHAHRDAAKTEAGRGDSSFARKSPGPQRPKGEKPKAQRGTKPARRKTNKLPQRPQRTQKSGRK
jgi:hypothetical protein